MKLQKLSATNFQMLSDVVLDLAARPITLIGAANEQGKTSIADAIAFAFTGTASRVQLKKDYGQLVRDGAKKGQVSIEWDGGKARVNLPSGSHLSEGDIPKAIEYVLQANRFSSLDPDARRTFLFNLLDAKIGSAELATRLTAKKHDPVKIGACGLGSGAPAAHKIAKGKASEARAAWKAVTNEAYGETKAETWTPPEVAFDPEDLELARDALSKADLEVTELNQTQGTYRAQKDALLQRERHMDGLRERTAKHDRIKEKLAVDEAGLADISIKLEQSRVAAGELPGKKAPDDLAELADIARTVLATIGTTQLVSTLSGEIIAWDDELVTRIQHALDEHRAAYGAGVEPSAETRDLANLVEERSRAYSVMKNSVDNDRRDLAAAELAAIELAELQGKEVITVPLCPEADLVVARNKQVNQRNEVRRLEALESAFATRTQNINKAKAHHADAQAWEAIAADLAPDGIPGELLKEALKPFNARLRDTAMTTGWSQVHVDADMAITIEGRSYALGSVSAKWRADAVIAEAVAFLSGTKILVIDGMDVLDLNNRGIFMEWIDNRVSAGELDTVLIFATLKELPKGFPDTWALYWLDDGVLYDSVQQQQAA